MAFVTDTDLAATGAGQGANMVGFIQDGPSAVARSTMDKLREIVSVKDFGAKGDGATDDTAAIQAALDFVGARGGGTVFLPMSAGRYVITSGLKLPSYTTLEGPASARYPFNAGAASVLVAKFTDPGQWVIEPKTTSGGAPVPHDMLVLGLASGPTYNCTVRNLTITADGGVIPYGGIRMHGCPGSVVENVAIDNVGCGLLVNGSFGGTYGGVHCLTLYYGVAGWNDVNANSFDVYCTQKDPALKAVPGAYRMSFMTALSGMLVPSHGLSTNDHCDRPFGFLLGGTASTSVGNTVAVTVEGFSGGVFALFAYSTNFTRCYLEGGVGQVDYGVVAADSRFTLGSLHAFMSGSGKLFDLGLNLTKVRINTDGIIFPGSYGSGPYPDNTSHVTFLSVGPDDLGPATPQFNISYPDKPGNWHGPSFSNGWTSFGDPRADAGYRLDRGNVEFQGAVTGGAAGTVAFALPAGYRPLKRMVFPDLQVDPNGAVTVFSAGIISLDGHRFQAQL